MTNRTHVILAALFVAGAAATGASAHGARAGGPGGGFDFVSLDADGDGSVTRAELLATASERIAIVDVDGDGAISREEIIATMPERSQGLRGIFAGDRAGRMADRMLERMGAGADGDVQASLMADRMVDRLITRMDRDADGAISQAEAEAPKRMRGGKERHGHGRDDRGQRHSGPDGGQDDAPRD